MHQLKYLFSMKRDQQIFDLIQQENERQLRGIELIASENFPKPTLLYMRLAFLLGIKY